MAWITGSDYTVTVSWQKIERRIELQEMELVSLELLVESVANSPVESRGYFTDFTLHIYLDRNMIQEISFIRLEENAHEVYVFASLGEKDLTRAYLIPDTALGEVELHLHNKQQNHTIATLTNTEPAALGEVREFGPSINPEVGHYETVELRRVSGNLPKSLLVLEWTYRG